MGLYQGKVAEKVHHSRAALMFGAHPRWVGAKWGQEKWGQKRMVVLKQKPGKWQVARSLGQLQRGRWA